MSKDLIEAYLWTTPNGEKISIMLEELAVPYEVHMVDISKNEQFAPEFLKISPNNKIPAIVDHDGPDGRPLAIFESGAILQYLGRKYEAFYPQNERKKAEVDQWLFWQIGGLGPMSGQCYHFRKYAPVKIDYGIERYNADLPSAPARREPDADATLRDRGYSPVRRSGATVRPVTFW